MVALALSSQNSFTDFEKISYGFLLVGFTLDVTKIKWRRKGALIGGIWGLICGVWYSWEIYVRAFSEAGYGRVIDTLFEKIIFLPVHIVDLLFFVENENWIALLFLLPFILWLLITWSLKISRTKALMGIIFLMIIYLPDSWLSFLGPIGYLFFLPRFLGLFTIPALLLGTVFGILIASALLVLSRARFEEVRE